MRRIEEPTLRSPFIGANGFISAVWAGWFQSIVLAFRLAVQQFTQIITTTYSAMPYDTLFCNVTGGGFTVTLPLASEAVNGQVRVFKIDASGNTLTISRAGSDKINGANTKTTTTQYAGWTLVSDGVSNWYVFG